MPSQLEAVSAFIEGTPPGQLANVITDIKALTADNPNILTQLGPVYRKYSEEQFATVKLPNSDQHVIVSSYNSLGDDRYFDIESSSSFAYNHSRQEATDVQSFVNESGQSDLIKSLSKSLKLYIQEHYPDAVFGVYPTTDDSEIAILLVANKYSPRNFWSGRWRSFYKISPTSMTLTGFIKVDVHYYENGNVRLLTTRPISESLSSNSAVSFVQVISRTEKNYQEELNKGFYNLNEGAFKGLRRQLPITRQKVEWDKIAGYRLGQDIGGVSNNRGPI